MLRATLLSPLACGAGVQLPLESTHPSQDEHVGWNLNEIPNPNTTDHFVFETVHSLLQHWPNTRMRNGHNIVPGIVPKGTTLYHGTGRKNLQPGPEWVSMDPEYAYLFCWDVWSNHFQDECWFLTLATTRPLKIVYFDGASSAKFPNGSLDTQELLAWGEIRPDYIFEELKRIKDLCKWAQELGLDGIDGNEFVMLCDFTSGVSEVSFVNLERPKGDLPMMSGFVTFEVINSGFRHSRLPGETRIQLDLAGLISFYDTQLVPSLVTTRAGQERWEHRVGNISSEDLLAVRSKVETVLTGPLGSLSGIDWKTHFQVIVEQFAERLELIQYLLGASASNPNDTLDFAKKTQTQLRIMLTPYLILSAMPPNPCDKTDLNWAIPIYKSCAITHTHTVEWGLEFMTYSEKLLLQAIRGTSREICRVVTGMWAVRVYAGIDRLNARDVPDMVKVTRVLGQWAENLGQLMAWLDWSVWVKCNPDCAPEEMCYLPTWPIGFPGYPEPPTDDTCLSGAGKHRENLTSSDLRLTAIAQGVSNVVQPEPDEWIRPHPKCIRRVEPYEL